MIANGEVFVDRYTATTIELDISLFRNHLAQRGSFHTSGPDLGWGLDGVHGIVGHVLVHDLVVINFSDHGIQTYFDALLLQGALCLLAQFLTERWKHLRCAVEKDDLR